MKRISNFQNKKMSFKDMKCTFGGVSYCIYTEDSTKGTCTDVKSSTYDDNGKLLVIDEQVTCN
ncbi:MAG: hypothetical protein LBC68_03995 [Prevotellaceae bacterium]|jgi:hypothetical protein|nr:hypothetical protein [Prevotellaceae bacterium]